MHGMFIVRESHVKMPARSYAQLVEDMLTDRAWEPLRLRAVTRAGHPFAFHARSIRSLREAACIELIATSNELSQPIFGRAEISERSDGATILKIEFDVSLPDLPSGLDRTLRDSLSLFADAIVEALAPAGSVPA